MNTDAACYQYSMEPCRLAETGLAAGWLAFIGFWCLVIGVLGLIALARARRHDES